MFAQNTRLPVLVALVLVVGCPQARPAQLPSRLARGTSAGSAPRRPAPQPDQPAPHMDQGDQATPSAAGTVFVLEGQRLTVSRAEGEAIRDALLARIESSTVEHRTSLLSRTRDADVQPGEDAMRIGSWYLQADGTRLRAMIRLGVGAAPAYAAEVVKQGQGFWVGELSPVFIHPRR